MKVASKSNWSKLECGVLSQGTYYHQAFTLTDLIAVMAVVAVLAVLLLQTQASTKAGAQRIHCVNNLKQVGMAFRLWADNHNEQFPMSVSVGSGGARPSGGWTTDSGMGMYTYRVYLVMSNELKSPKVVVCPADFDMRPPATTFIPIGPTAEFTNNARVSYFVGRDADQTMPRMLLSGDRNIYGPATRITDNGGYGNSKGPGDYSGAALSIGTNLYAVVGWTDKLHQREGNICLSDGSVQQVTTSHLKDAFNQSGDTRSSMNVNFILYP